MNVSEANAVCTILDALTLAAAGDGYAPTADRIAAAVELLADRAGRTLQVSTSTRRDLAAAALIRACDRTGAR